MRKTYYGIFLIHQLLIIPILLLLYSCSYNRNKDSAYESSSKKQELYSAINDSLKPPRITLLTNLADSNKPVTVDIIKKPVTVSIPVKTGGYHILRTDAGVEKVNLSPPIIKPASEAILSFTNYSTEQGLSLSTIVCSYMDKSGNLWFGSRGGGVSKFDGRSFTTYTTANGLADNTVWCITEDKEGNLWFGTQGNGASRFDGKVFKTYSTPQGLGNKYVWSILQDQKGNIWFGTSGGGVSRLNHNSLYDPNAKLVTYNIAQGLANNVVLSMLEDKDGNLWLGTRGGGVNRYNQTEANTSCHQNSCKHDLKKTEDKNVHNKTIAKAFTTISTSHGLANNLIKCLMEDKNGNIWLGTLDGGLSRYDVTRKKNACNSNTCKHNLGNPKEQVDHNQEISKFITSYTTAQGMAHNQVVRILEDKSGLIWLAHGQSFGISRLNHDGKTFTKYTTDQGLSSNAVWAINEDKNNNLWFGTQGGGILRLTQNGKAFTGYTDLQGLANNRVWDIFEDKKGKLWFGTVNGLSSYDGATFTTYTVAQGLIHNNIWSIGEDHNGEMWFGSRRYGVSRLNRDGKSFTSYTTDQGLIDNRVWSILVDRTGYVWFGTGESGVSRFESKSLFNRKERFTNFSVKQGLANNAVTCMMEDKKGNIWFGTDGGGASCYNGNYSPKDEAGFTTYSRAQGLASNAVSSVFEDRNGYIWFGTLGGGISRFDGKTFITYTSENGLANNIVTSIVEDTRGVIWFGTNEGFCGLRFQNLNSTAKETKGAGQLNVDNKAIRNYSPVWEIYNYNYGYLIKDIIENTMRITKIGLPKGDRSDVGKMWFSCGDDKVIRFDQSAITVDSIVPSVVIQNIRINNEKISWNNIAPEIQNYSSNKAAHPADNSETPPNTTEEVTTFGKAFTIQERDSIGQHYKGIKFKHIAKWYPIPEKLVLPYKFNNISFDFNALETGRNFLMKYQYMLKGYDKDWSQPNTKTSANFGNMYEGTYTFLLKAQNPDGIWSDPISYTFKVLPPWWRTWWMYTTYGLLAIGFVVFIVRWNNRKLIAQKKILEHKVAVATKEIRKEKEKVEDEKKRGDELLLNILPEEIAEELKLTGTAKAKDFSEVTVLFTDFKNFTRMSEQCTAQQLVNEINYYYSAFDKIVTKYGIEKIKTIGDSYMCAGGLPVENCTNAEDTVRAALEIRDFILNEKEKRNGNGKPFFEIRIGLHTGPVVAGIVGIKKFAYDIWGDTVNIASRMESSGEPGKVNISGDTYELIKEKFTCTLRGKIQAKNKGEIEMYFVEN